MQPELADNKCAKISKRTSWLFALSGIPWFEKAGLQSFRMSDFEVTVELQQLVWRDKLTMGLCEILPCFAMFGHVLSCFGSFLQLRWLRHVFGSLCGSPLREPALFADSTGQQVAFAVGRQLAIRHVAKQHVPCIHWSISLTSLQVEYVTLTANWRGKMQDEDTKKLHQIPSSWPLMAGRSHH